MNNIDPYVYPNGVLKNKLNILDAEKLSIAERNIALSAIVKLKERTFHKFDYEFLLRLHKEMFFKIYDWAGKPRTITISKRNSLFCPAEHITSYAAEIFGNLKKNNFFRNLEADEFALKSANFFADLNALHPFREGNGRTSRLFIFHLAKSNNFLLDLTEVDKEKYLEAVIDSMDKGANEKLEKLFLSTIKPYFKEQEKKNNLKLKFKNNFEMER